VNSVECHVDLEKINAEFEKIVLAFAELFHFFFERSYFLHGHIIRKVLVVGLGSLVLLVFKLVDVFLEFGEVFVAEVFFEALLLFFHHFAVFLQFAFDCGFVFFDVLPTFDNVFGQFGVRVFFR